MGYGAKALGLLKDYYEFKISNIDEETNGIQEEIKNVEEDELGLLEESIEPRKSLPPLLLKLSERTPEVINYIGVSFGLTEQLLKFWYIVCHNYFILINYINIFIGKEQVLFQYT